MLSSIREGEKISLKDEYYIQHPAKQTFYKVIAYIMGIYGLNSEYWSWFERPSDPMHHKAYMLQRYIVIIFVPITSASQTLNLILHYKEYEFYELSVMLAIMPVGYVVTVKSASAQTETYRQVMKSFMEKIHLYNYLDVEIFNEQKRDFVAQELVRAEKRTRQTLIFVMTLVLVCLFSWNTVPILHNVKHNDNIHNITKRLEVCVHFWMPFDYEYNFKGHLFVLVIGFYCGFVACIVMNLFDTINFAFIFHLVGHIGIIKYDLKHGFTEKGLTEEQLKTRLVNINKYYCFITETFQAVTAAYGLNVASIYAQNLVQGGLLLYQFMSAGKDIDTLLTFGLMIPIFMGLLVLVSLTLENVRIQAEDIPALVYDLPWESMSVSNQKMVLLILNQVQPTLEFLAAFNIKTGVQPAINIFKTTFSYYVMIKSKDE